MGFSAFRVGKGLVQQKISVRDGHLTIAIWLTCLVFDLPHILRSRHAEGIVG